MKIWRCLCFGEEEEEYSNREAMRDKEGTSVNNDVDEGNNGSDGNEDLGFHYSGDGDGEPSSCLVADDLEMDGLDRGAHCKRPKVQSLTLERDTPFVYVPAQEEYEIMLNEDHLVDSTSLDVNQDDQVSTEMNDLDNRMDLTDDLLHLVFSFLDQISLCEAARVCKQWHTASQHEDFWWFLNFEDRNISPQQFKDMCNRYPNATQVNIKGSAYMHTLAMQSLSSLRNLEILTLGKGQLWERFFLALPDCTMLNSLIVTDAVLGNGHQEITIHHDRLRHLQIMKCRMVRVSVRCPELQTLSLKRSSMAHAVLNCPLLRDLDIASCHKLLDAAVRSAATSCPLLETLDMSNCSCVSDETLREISIICASLHILNASYCPNISLEAVRFPMLTLLKLHSCEGITSASIAAIAWSYMLEVLELDNCSLLTSVFLDLPRLQNIRLVHCCKLVDLSLRSMVLSSIKISNCPSLLRINITSSSLQQLILQKQESLTTLELNCECLQEVDLTDCESLTNSIFEVFSDHSGCGCPMLKSLTLDNCERLTAVVFSSNSVRSLSFAGCHAITSLELTCPNLEQVSLDGCDHLENATFCPRLTAVVFSSNSVRSLSFAGCHAITSLELTCPNLEQVSLDGCDHLENATFCPVGLQSLNLGICPKLSVLNIDAPSMVQLELKGCGVLSESHINCPLLKSLDASFCSQLKDDFLSTTTASCPLIESLILMSCLSIGSDGLMSLCWLLHLTLLDLSYTYLSDLQPVFNSCLQLKVLKLQACKDLTDSSLKPLYKANALPALVELDLSYGTLCHSAIEELLACCTRLTHLNLNGCVNMHDMNWSLTIDLDFDFDRQSHLLLQNLNCVGCPNVKKVVIPRLARFSHLSSLNLSLSVNLKDVDLACSNLCFLNLSNCCSLESLKLVCPRLITLFLQSCNIGEEVIESAVSHCNTLETLDIRFCSKISALSIVRLRTACPSLKRIFTSLVPV